MTPLLFTLLTLPPTGTTTAKLLGEWLTQATGEPHAIGGELQDYPVFLAVRSGEPGRIKALVAAALAGEWTKDGSTIRLMPVKPKSEEGMEEFARAWKVASAARPSLAELPVRDLFAMRAGETVRYGLPTGPYVRPLPATLRKRVEASETRNGAIYVRRFSNGCFETSVNTPDEQVAVFSGNSQVEFRSLPPALVAALGDEAKKPAMNPEEVAALQKRAQPSKVDPTTIRSKDPLTRFVDPALGAVARSISKDLVVAVPDFAVMALMGEDKTTVQKVLEGFCLFDDWQMVEGAVIGRLPVSERRNRSQTRRSVMANFIRRTQDVGVPSASAVAEYLSGQRPAASEGWTDVMMLILCGVALDQTEIGDYPYNLRFGAALNPVDWTRLRTGRPLPVATLSVNARNALIALFVQSRKRMDWQNPDPVRWPGFPNVDLILTAKVEEEDVLLGPRSGATEVMQVAEAGNGYARAKKDLGAEPLYRVGHRRKILLTIAPALGEPVKTGFADVAVDKGAQALPWTNLPAAMREAFEAALKRRENVEPPAGAAQRPLD